MVRKTSASTHPGARTRSHIKSLDKFGNVVTWQKGESGEKVKVTHSGEGSKWNSDAVKYEGPEETKITVPDSRWVITIPKKAPETAYAYDGFHNLNSPVRLTEKPEGLRIPDSLANETFAVFEDGKGRINGIGINSLFSATGKAPQKPEPVKEEKEKTEPQPAPPESKPVSPRIEAEIQPASRQAEPQKTSFAPPPPGTLLEVGQGTPPGMSPRVVQAQKELDNALAGIASAEKNATPPELRGLEKLHHQAESYAAQAASGNNDDSARLSIPRFYSQMILQEARAGHLKNPALVDAAKNYLQKEDALRNSYVQDAWQGIQDVWKNSPPEWQKYYASRWKGFQGRSPDPWQAFAVDAVQNGAPQEEAMKKAAINYLNWDSLRRSNMNPFLYPQVMAGSTNSFGQQQFNNSGGQDVMGNLMSNPLIQAMYSNINNALTASAGWILNLWGPSPSPGYFYNSPYLPNRTGWDRQPNGWGSPASRFGFQ